MSVLLFKLHNVAEDEADDVRQLMQEHGFAVYESHGGVFGLGVAAIWLEDDTQLQAARAVIDEYQAQRSTNQRRAYAEQKARGEIPTIGQKLQAEPLKFVGIVVVVVLVLAVSVLPIWSLVGA